MDLLMANTQHVVLFALDWGPEQKRKQIKYTVCQIGEQLLTHMIEKGWAHLELLNVKVFLVSGCWI